MGTEILTGFCVPAKSLDLIPQDSNPQEEGGGQREKQGTPRFSDWG